MAGSYLSWQAGGSLRTGGGRTPVIGRAGVTTALEKPCSDDGLVLVVGMGGSPSSKDQVEVVGAVPVVAVGIRVPAAGEREVETLHAHKARYVDQERHVVGDDLHDRVPPDPAEARLETNTREERIGGIRARGTCHPQAPEALDQGAIPVRAGLDRTRLSTVAGGVTFDSTCERGAHSRWNGSRPLSRSPVTQHPDDGGKDRTDLHRDYQPLRQEGSGSAFLAGLALLPTARGWVPAIQPRHRRGDSFRSTGRGH
jgi:hypothetical protein